MNETSFLVQYCSEEDEMPLHLVGGYLALYEVNLSSKEALVIPSSTFRRNNCFPSLKKLDNWQNKILEGL